MRDTKASRTFAILAACGAAIVAILVLHQWLAREPSVEVSLRLPGGDGRPEDASSGSLATDLSGTFQEFSGVAADLPGNWPRFRGPDFDNIYKQDY
ncbi:MAG: hypothetical protein R6V12_04270, partial [Candidatus Hydrogenedentota bacterium]